MRDLGTNTPKNIMGKNVIYGFIILLVIFFVYTFLPSRKEVNVDGRKWQVIDSYENSTEAAQILSRCHDKILRFMRVLKEKYHIDEPLDVAASHYDPNSHETNLIPQFHGSAAPSDDVQRIVETFLDNYNPDVFYENDPKYSNDTSYTMNKGDSMYIALRKKNDPTQFESEDTIFFVMLHECAHIANYNGWGHDDRFWTVFKFLLHEAVEAGIYTPIDYAKNPEPYVSIEIYYQPLHDNGLPNLWEKQ